MAFQPLDIAAFIGFLALVVGISLYASRGKHDAADYFLAGRNLPWWLIGFSLIASNISTEHFVGMAGRGYDLGLAIASYEWMAAVTLAGRGRSGPLGNRLWKRQERRDCGFVVHQTA